MSEISKQALKVDNNTSFPNNNTGYISPSILRAFNVNMIDSLVEQAGYTTDSASWNADIAALEAFTASQQPSFTSLNAFTASQIVVNTNLNAFTQSAGDRLGDLEQASASLEAFTASINQIQSNGVVLGTSTRFNFVGSGSFFSASITPNVNGAIATLTLFADTTKLNTSSFNEYTQSINAFSASASISIAALNAFTTSIDSEVDFLSSSFNDLSQSVSASIQELLALSSSLSGGFATQGELDASASALQANIDTKLSTSSFNAYTASQSSLNGTFATTGSNTFRGIETFEDAAGNATSLVSTSGSIMFVSKGYTSGSAHLTSSANSFVNLIFKDNNVATDTLISGSNNIFSNPVAASGGFRRFMTSNNLFLGSGSVPQITGSTQSLPTLSQNISIASGLGFNLRTPISSSASTILSNLILGGNFNLGSTAANNAEKLLGGYSITSNLINNNFNIDANQSNISSSVTIARNVILSAANTIAVSSSAISATGNIHNGANTVLNQYYSQSLGLGSATYTNNLINGTNTIIISGSNPAGVTNTPAIANNSVFGTRNTLFSDVSNAAIIGTNAYFALASTLVAGEGLIITGSSLGSNTATLGSVFAGRFNAVDGNKAKTAQTVFAIGAGTSTSVRKTAFLIDSASNAFVEGSLNVSSSLSITGSAYGNVFSASIASNTASIDLSVANFFTLALPNGVNTRINITNPRPGTTAILEITNNGIATASFNSNVKQQRFNNYEPTSGSAVDLLSIISLSTSSIYVANSLNFV